MTLTINFTLTYVTYSIMGIHLAIPTVLWALAIIFILYLLRQGWKRTFRRSR